MKSYKIIENGKPIEQVEIEKPIPVAMKFWLKQFRVGSVIQTFISMKVSLI